jgi:D-Tyr-tRNAtyr deacylase
MYEAFGEACRKGYRADKVQMGHFGATCQISLINDVRLLSRVLMLLIWPGTNDDTV